MSTDPAGFGLGDEGGAPTEDELRAAYEAELKRIRVEQVLLEHVVTMINLGMRRTGLAAGTEEERDPDQVRLAIESIRALIPLIEEIAPGQAGQIRSALSQLQLGFVRIGGRPGPAEAPDAGAPPPPGAPPAPGAPPPPGASPAPGWSPDPGASPAGGPVPGPDPAPLRPGADPSRPGGAEPDGPGPAQRSGRLWVPGQ